ncbi:cell wall-binding protein [Clostridium sp. AF18-27]|uniref:cell wall-binding protein n=1 Tax=Enterocloster lavalensis TaxID=460384 RepID=UPI000E522843|nr:cell wall-binding protein [Enterocloster lavalensis]RHR48256.1 cell wall-binding protein [Clostridium sp. AF18-27]
MRKQTKLVAVLSTAALLAIGASMTSFAAQGWAEEDGTWVYYDKNGDRVTDSWKKSGDNWFWLDDSGEMATDMLIEDDDDYYYVDANGAMVRNQWVAIENEDAGEEDEPDHYWYYFQSNGKAYKRSDSATTISAKTINGKKYAFDTDGKMLFGWVNSSFERDDEDDAWQTCDYYFGGEDDGAMVVNNFALISITDEDADDAQPGDDFWDEEQDRYFYFKASGKKQGEHKGKNINGRKYGFDKYGRMIASWSTTLSPVDKSHTAVNTATDSDGNPIISTQGSATYSSSFMYYSSPEDGARYSKNWFKVVPGYYLHQDKYEEDAEYWYYADSDGNLYTNTIERYKGKKYAFDEYGRMISGLALLRMEDGSNTAIAEKIASDDPTFPYENEDEFNTTVAKLTDSGDLQKGNYAFYYFGSSEDGAMKTGKQTISLDGDTATFKFKTTSSDKGVGITGLDDKKYYVGGKLIKADKEDKYDIVLTKDDVVLGDTDDGTVRFDIKQFIKEFGGVLQEKDDKEYKKDQDTWVFKTDKTKNCRVINASGTVAKGKTVKDGDGYKITVDSNYAITKIVLED